jgi:hypothetical protein
LPSTLTSFACVVELNRCAYGRLHFIRAETCEIVLQLGRVAHANDLKSIAFGNA